MSHTTEDILITSLLVKHIISTEILEIKSLLTKPSFFISLHNCTASIFNKNTLISNLQILTLKLSPTTHKIF